MLRRPPQPWFMYVGFLSPCLALGDQLVATLWPDRVPGASWLRMASFLLDTSWIVSPASSFRVRVWSLGFMPASPA